MPLAKGALTRAVIVPFGEFNPSGDRHEAGLAAFVDDTRTWMTWVVAESGPGANPLVMCRPRLHRHETVLSDTAPARDRAMQLDQHARLSVAPMMDWVVFNLVSIGYMMSCAFCVQSEIASWRAVSGVWRLCGFGQIDAR